LNWQSNIAIAFKRIVNTTSVDSALAGVNSVRVISGPEILLISVSVVPPGVGDCIELQWSVVAIVLYKKGNFLT
jgi:hypothetical protein